jgi:hypothetical protein
MSDELPETITFTPGDWHLRCHLGEVRVSVNCNTTVTTADLPWSVPLGEVYTQPNSAWSVYDERSFTR